MNEEKKKEFLQLEFAWLEGKLEVLLLNFLKLSYLEGGNFNFWTKKNTPKNFLF